VLRAGQPTDQHVAPDAVAEPDLALLEAARFDANPRMAEACIRLAEGKPHPSDFGLLQHALFEAKYMRDTGNPSYSRALRHNPGGIHLGPRSGGHRRDELPTGPLEPVGKGVHAGVRSGGAGRGFPQRGLGCGWSGFFIRASLWVPKTPSMGCDLPVFGCS
jgi:hypothetical protein